jgi:hypothetical protein
MFGYIPSPRARDAVDFGTLARDPGTRFDVPLTAHRQSVFDPSRNCVFKIARVNPSVPQSRYRSRAYLMGMHAIDDDPATGRPPCRQL